jgi:transposase
VFPPSYSPDCNPIETTFSKLKALLRKAERSISGWWDVIGRLTNLVEPLEFRNYFLSCGYDPA